MVLGCSQAQVGLRHVSGLREGHPGGWFSLGACDIPREEIRRVIGKDAQSRILGNVGEKP